MAFCANCGNKVGDNDKFCANCGATRVPGTPNQSEPPPPPPPIFMSPSGSSQGSGSGSNSATDASGASTTELKPNVAALICYFGIWIAGIVFLILEKKNKFVRFHAAQSLVFFGFVTILNGVLGGFFWNIHFISGFLNGLIGLFAFAMWIVLMVKAYQGEWYKLPVAGDIAEGIVGK
jgi:uncharacterized membrane protein